MIIAIDGTAASGKGTLAKKMAGRLGLPHLDTGALYRIIGQMLRQDGMTIDTVTVEKAAEAAENIDLSLMNIPAIRTAEASVMAAHIADIPQVRSALISFQRSFAKRDTQGAILDGRDIGTIILPDADVKFFVDADLDIRAERRFTELQAAGETVVLDSIKSDLAKRDDRDRNRKIAPLKRADDAIMIDTSRIDIESMVDFACDYLPK